MKTITKIKHKLCFGFLALFLLVTSCVYIDSIDVPEIITPGETAQFDMNVHIDFDGDAENDRLVIAVLMPTSWNPSENVTVTYTSDYSGDEGVQTMSVIPDTEMPAGGDGVTWPEHLHNTFGVGPNTNENMQWVAFKSDKEYTISSGETVAAQVNITALVGNDDLDTQLGFFMNFISNGLEVTADDTDDDPDNDNWRVEYIDPVPTASIAKNSLNATKVYPNPFTDDLNIKLNLEAGNDYLVTMTDVTGKKISSFKGTSLVKNDVLNLNSNANLSALPSGVYMVNVTSGKNTSTYKIVKK